MENGKYMKEERQNKYNMEREEASKKRLKGA